MTTWLDFWGGSPRLYVNERHLGVHCARIAADLAQAIGRVPGRRVLDFGCGDALAAPALAEATGAELLLYDAAPAVRRRLASRFAGATGIVVLDEAGWNALRPASVDTIVMVSVAQYMATEDLARLLGRMHRLLRPDGVVIVGDLIPPGADLVADLAALLGPAARHRFLGAALVGLVRTFFSDYRRLRAERGLTRYREADFVALARRSGFRAERLPFNPGFNRKRMAFRARKA